MKKKQIIGLVIAAVLCIAVGVSSVLTNTFSQKMLNDSVEHILTGDYRFNAPLSDFDWSLCAVIVGSYTGADPDRHI